MQLISRRGSALVVHFVILGSHQLVKHTWVLFDLLFELIAVIKIDRPSQIVLGHQVVALWMVDSILLPAVDEFFLECDGLVALDESALALEVTSDKFVENDSLRWIAHVYFKLIII